jgi:protein-S-isoprenylcysteine O-methyltransferase Ste14
MALFGPQRSGLPRTEHPWLTTLRLGLTVAGLILFGYGVHADVEWLRWVGIALFAVVVALRFWPHRSASGRDGSPNG